ncbi:hypothetical protein Z946_3047 [Sulfitobacter noctilucicola]|nr:hypothetical protein Z946_3047 [Sulfitobacter noctilucicola]
MARMTVISVYAPDRIRFHGRIFLVSTCSGYLNYMTTSC